MRTQLWEKHLACSIQNSPSAGLWPREHICGGNQNFPKHCTLSIVSRSILEGKPHHSISAKSQGREMRAEEGLVIFNKLTRTFVFSMYQSLLATETKHLRNTTGRIYFDIVLRFQSILTETTVKQNLSSPGSQDESTNNSLVARRSAMNSLAVLML